MQSAGPSVPFKIPNVYQGFAEACGIAHASGSQLVLEFQVKDTIAGLVKSSVNEVSVPFTDLVSVHLHSGWFSTRLTIRTRRLAALKDIPGSEQGGVELTIARKDKHAAAELASLIALTLAERQLQDLSRSLT